MSVKRMKLTPVVHIPDDIWENICSFLTSTTWEVLIKLKNKSLYYLFKSPRILEVITWQLNRTDNTTDSFDILFADENVIIPYVRKLQISNCIECFNLYNNWKTKFLDRFELLFEAITHITLYRSSMRLKCFNKLCSMSLFNSTVTINNSSLVGYFPNLRSLTIDEKSIVNSKFVIEGICGTGLDVFKMCYSDNYSNTYYEHYNTSYIRKKMIKISVLKNSESCTECIQTYQHFNEKVQNKKMNKIIYEFSKYLGNVQSKDIILTEKQVIKQEIDMIDSRIRSLDKLKDLYSTLL